MRPSAIANFERLFLASLLLGISVLFLFSPPGDGLPLLEIGILALSLVLVLLVSRRRSNAIRWVLTVLVVLGVPLLIYPLFQGDDIDTAFLLSVLSSALQLSAVALLWTKDGKTWFERDEVAAG